MFTPDQKQYISEMVEDALLSVEHPEMYKERPVFKLFVAGKSIDSWAEIEPNWMHEKGWNVALRPTYV